MARKWRPFRTNVGNSSVFSFIVPSYMQVEERTPGAKDEFERSEETLGIIPSTRQGPPARRLLGMAPLTRSLECSGYTHSGHMRGVLV